MAYNDLSWQKEAACFQKGNRIWFSQKPGYECKAKTICSLCPVRKPCLKFAMRTRQPYGVWGGLTKQERDILRTRILVRRLERSQAIPS